MPKLSPIERASHTTPLVGAAPRPWRLEVAGSASGRRAMAVYAADGEIVEYRQAGGHTPETFARHVANATHYVAAVNAQEFQQ